MSKLVTSYTHNLLLLGSLIILLISYASPLMPRYVPLALAAPTDLFFSEYVEGSSNNKALEIYNSTGSTIDLLVNNYDIQFYSNGNVAAKVTIALTGSVISGDVYVLADDGAASAILTQADQTSTSPFFNGDDAVVLRKNGTIIDVIGQIGFDPGSQWSNAGVSTKDKTMRRKPTIKTGDANGLDAFDPSLEWAGFAKDTFDGLGSHTITSTSSPPSVITTNPANGATNIAINSTIIIQFSEVVTTTANTFLLECPSSTPIAFTTAPPPPGNVDTFTLTTPNLPNSTACTATVVANQVTDHDSVPVNMTANYSFTFTTVVTVAPPAPWIINEIHADPDATNGDANGDGVVSSGQDEFVEIINNTGNTVDISGWTLSDNSRVRHTYPAGTLLPDQCAMVVFGGGTPTGSFGDALVQTAGSLGLNNSGDTVTFSDGGGVTQAAYTYGSEGGDNQALTRNPDLSGGDPLLKHATATGSGGILFSPGTTIDGAKFAGCSLPRVTATAPANGTTKVAVNSPLTIQFSELVTTTANTFSLECPTGTPIAFTPTPSPPGNTNAFTLTPTADLSYSITCTATVRATDVIDQDDTPETMVADYTFTFTTAAVVKPILISEFLYDGQTPSSEGDEFVELCNPHPTTVDLTGYKVGDEETNGGGESMYQIPVGTILAPAACLTIAKSAADFQARFGVLPTFETSALAKYSVWGSGSWSLSNTGDELLVLGPGDQILDSVAYRNGDYAILGLAGEATAPEPDSLQRIWPLDTDSMPYDFVQTVPTPGLPTITPAPTITPPAALPNGMNAYWGHLHAHTTYSDGAGPPHYALDLARSAGLHFYGLSDHGWWLTAGEWSNTLSQTTAATVPGQFVALRGLEWTHSTAGHINIFGSDTLLARTNPLYDDLSDFYTWLAANPNAVAQFNHPDPDYGGTFNDFAPHPAAAQMVFLQEIGNNAQHYTTYEPSFVHANAVGWKVAPTNNSDTHNARWGSDHTSRTGLVAPSLTESDLLAALRARRVFATEDSNLALTLRGNGQWMGSTLPSAGSLTLIINVVDPDPEPITLYLYDRNLVLQTISLPNSTQQWQPVIEALPGHFYWIKAIQADGDTAYSSPLWLAGTPPADTLFINEILPAPNDIDWDGDGIGDSNDEWIELYNPLARPLGLGGWRMQDATGITYNIPLSATVPAKGFATLYKAQTGISLNNGGDSLTLFHPNGTIIDSFSYDHSPGYDETWCRLPDSGPTWSADCVGSPNGANWERPAAEPLTVKIFEAKRLSYNAWVKVKGSVTAPPGVFGSRTMYIQDDTAGIMIYLPRDHRLFDLQLGDIVEVEGNLKTFRGEFDIATSHRNNIKTKGHGPPPPPLPIETTSLLEPYEGLLVQLQGQTVSFRGRTTLYVDDSSGWAKVVIRRSTGIKKPFIDYGTPTTVVGIVSQYTQGDTPSRADYRLLPRYQFDLIFTQTESEPTPQPSSIQPMFLPETGDR